MSVPDVSGKAIANLEIESLKHVAPTFHGDTIYGETTVLDKTPSKSKSDRGIVYVETKGYKQDGTLVCVFRRKVMVPTETYIKERGGEQPGRPELTEAEGEVAMARLAQTAGLTDIQQEILSTVRDFVDKEIIPVATELEHRDEYPTQIVEGLKELGLFGLMIPEEYGGLGESLLTYALCVEEIARGWMSRLGHHQHALHRGVHAQAARHAGAEGPLPAADGAGRGARRVLDVGAGPRLGRVGHHVQGRARTATSTSSTARRCG